MTTFVGFHVLIVEDRDFQRFVLMQLLESFGAERISQSESGAQALACLGGDPAVDWMIMDRHLSGMSGAELLEAVAASGFPVPVILVTGDDLEALRRGSQAACAQGFRVVTEIVKPVARTVLQGACGLTSCCGDRFPEGVGVLANPCRGRRRLDCRACTITYISAPACRRKSLSVINGLGQGPRPSSN